MNTNRGAIMHRFTSCFVLTELLSLWSRTALHRRSPSAYHSTTRQVTALPANGENFVSYKTKEQAEEKCVYRQRERWNHLFRQKHCWYRSGGFHSISCLTFAVCVSLIWLNVNYKMCDLLSSKLYKLDNGLKHSK